LALAKGLIENWLADQVLLITADTYSKLIHPKDRSVRTLFGDGAAATFISHVMSEEELIGPFVFGTDGSGGDKLIVPAGGFRLKISEETGIEKEDGNGNIRSLENLYMDGPEIFNFSLREVPKTVNILLQKCNMTKEDIDFYIFHQANKFMLEQLRRKLKIPEEKFCINMESYGNTVAATIPMAIEIAKATGQIQEGFKIMLVGFGVGYSWSANIIRMCY
jgi:3-oxoacyl-[acyl-carrier-protein] synthase-3